MNSCGEVSSSGPAKRSDEGNGGNLVLDRVLLDCELEDQDHWITAAEKQLTTTVPKTMEKTVAETLTAEPRAPELSGSGEEALESDLVDIAFAILEQDSIHKYVPVQCNETTNTFKLRQSQERRIQVSFLFPNESIFFASGQTVEFSLTNPDLSESLTFSAVLDSLEDDVKKTVSLFFDWDATILSPSSYFAQEGTRLPVNYAISILSKPTTED